LYVKNKKPLLMHFDHIAVLTICLISIIYFTDMLPQHHVYRNELNCESYNTTLARRNVAPWWWSKKKRSKHVGVILIVFKCFMWNLCKCNCWLIIEVNHPNCLKNNNLKFNYVHYILCVMLLLSSKVILEWTF